MELWPARLPISMGANFLEVSKLGSLCVDPFIFVFFLFALANF